MKPEILLDSKGNKFFMGQIKIEKIVNSEYNPRELKTPHKNELKKSIEDRGQMVPIVGYMSQKEYDEAVEEVIFSREEEA